MELDFSKKPIILIGGTAGSGKTTLAGNLACSLKVDHRLGTGFVREIVRTLTTRDQDPEIFTSTYETQDPIRNIQIQASKLYQPILSCIERARKEGTSLIIEGNHLLPHLYYQIKVDYFFILSAPNENQHMIQFTGKTHTKRVVTEQDLMNARKIDTFLKKSAPQYNVKCIALKDADITKLIDEIQ